VKTHVVVWLLFAAGGCASPLSGEHGDSPFAGPDLAMRGVGGSADDMAEPPLVVVDMAMKAADPVDMAQPLPVVDMAKPLPIPDMTPLCKPPAGSVCNIYPQCGCADGQACDLDAAGNGVCRVAGTIADWNVCPASGNACKKGSTCVNGTCAPFCGTKTAPSSHCDTNAECYQGPVNGTTVPNNLVCSSNCDPASPQSASGGYVACGASTNCLPIDDGYAYCSSPVKATGGGDGANCYNSTTANTDSSKCKPGFICLTNSAGTIFECLQQCHVDGSGTKCARGTCNGYSPKTMVGGLEIGYCN